MLGQKPVVRRVPGGSCQLFATCTLIQCLHRSPQSWCHSAGAHPGSGNTSTWSAAGGGAPACTRRAPSSSSCRAPGRWYANSRDTNYVSAANTASGGVYRAAQVASRPTCTGGALSPSAAAPCCCRSCNSWAGDASEPGWSISDFDRAACGRNGPACR